MELGIMADGPQEGFDLTICEIKMSSGRVLEPVPGVYNAVNCLADNRMERLHPENLALSEGGRATRRNLRRDSAWVCPTHPQYWDRLLDIIEKAAAVGEGIVLESLGFPGEGYCTCERCQAEWKASGLGWEEWKCSVVTEFVAAARARLGRGELGLSLHPDPITPRAYGYNLVALSEHADFFIAPLYARSYSTAYWVGLLAKAYRLLLTKPFYTALYARVPEEELYKAAMTAAPYSDGIVFFGDVERARRVAGRISPSASPGARRPSP